MKTNIIFERLTCIVLFIALACNFLATPNQTVSAKALAGPFTDCATQTEIPETECNALLILYTNTNGANWFVHTGWLQTDTPCSWAGVTCDSGYVTGLSLSKYNLSGTIPTELASLTHLTSLTLGNNALSGPIPTELANLTNLTSLILASNALSGPIPTELANLTNLTTLDLNANALSGPIPTELGSLTHLTMLGLSGTGLMSGDGFSGPIPTELASLTNLTMLYLSHNALSGFIPAQLGGLTNLTRLYLNDNGLSGTIPPELGNLTQLNELDLDENALSGSIPAQMSNLTQLQVLDLHNNALSGEFPSSITNLVNLVSFRFDCQLTSSDSDVIAFIDVREPGWQNSRCVPSLASPPEAATLDNGRLDWLDDIIWDFDWSDVPGATKYQLYVTHSGASTAMINLANIVASSYHYIKLNSYITNANRSNWQWKVRAYVNDQWADWSQVRTFNLEALNSDAAQALAKNGGLNAYPGAASRIPSYWKAAKFSITDGKTTSTKHEGAASVKISGVAGTTKTLSQTLNVSGPAGDRLIFSYWVKGSAIPAGGVCQGQVSFYNGTILKGVKILKCPNGANYNFRKMTLNLSAPTAYTKVVITFTYSKPSGTVWFDSVSLIR